MSGIVSNNLETVSFSVVSCQSSITSGACIVRLKLASVLNQTCSLGCEGTAGKWNQESKLGRLDVSEIGSTFYEHEKSGQLTNSKEQHQCVKNITNAGKENSLQSVFKMLKKLLTHR